MELDNSPSEYWKQTRLRHARLDLSTSAKGLPMQAVGYAAALISRVLESGYALRSNWETAAVSYPIRPRTTPSAGCLYPFEMMVSTSSEYFSEAFAGLYDYDLENRRLVRRSNLTTTALSSAANIPIVRGTLATIILVSRPWKSMKKYGARGYFYSWLDSSHAAVSVAMAAQSLGLKSTIYLHFRRETVSSVLGVSDHCMETQIIVSVEEDKYLAAASTNEAHHIEWTLELAAKPFCFSPTYEETNNWDLLRAVRPDSFANVPASPRSESSICTSREPNDSEQSPIRRANEHSSEPPPYFQPFHSIAHVRRSAKGFNNAPVSFDQITNLLRPLGACLRISTCHDRKLSVGLRLIAINVTGLRAGVYRYIADSPHLEECLNAPIPTHSLCRSACMNQLVASNAAAFVVLHAPVSTVIERHGAAGLVEVHFHAAHVAHKLLLASAETAIGATCIGGFDDMLWKSVSSMTMGDEAVYVLAFGIPDDRSIKLDRQ